MLPSILLFPKNARNCSVSEQKDRLARMLRSVPWQNGSKPQLDFLPVAPVSCYTLPAYTLSSSWLESNICGAWFLFFDNDTAAQHRLVSKLFAGGRDSYFNDDAIATVGILENSGLLGGGLRVVIIIISRDIRDRDLLGSGDHLQRRRSFWSGLGQSERLKLMMSACLIRCPTKNFCVQLKNAQSTQSTKHPFNLHLPPHTDGNPLWSLSDNDKFNCLAEEGPGPRTPPSNGNPWWQLPLQNQSASFLYLCKTIVSNSQTLPQYRDQHRKVISLSTSTPA